MKSLLVCAALLIPVTSSHAAVGLWIDSQEPPISLSQALVIAKKALHKRAKDFHCVNAHLIKSRSVKGEWTLRFSSKSGESRYVIVTFDKPAKVWVSKGPLAG